MTMTQFGPRFILGDVKGKGEHSGPLVTVM
jgi:hypothetical protein